MHETGSRGIIDDVSAQLLRGEIYRRLEGIPAGVAVPQMPNAVLLDVFRPYRRKQQIAALRAPIADTLRFRRHSIAGGHDVASRRSKFLARAEARRHYDDTSNTIDRNFGCREGAMNN
jgi:hypothetical protein